QSGESNMVKALEQAQASPNAASMKPFIDALMKSGLLTTQPGQPELVKAGVGFIDLGSAEGQKPGLGLYVSAHDGQNLKNALTSIETVFKDEGYEPVRRAASPEGFSIALKAAGEGAPDLGNVHFVANERLMAVVTQEALVDRLFGQSADNGMK